MNQPAVISRAVTVLAALAVFCSTTGLSAAEPTAEQVKFFETSIRPLLVAQCFKCHGPDKQWANLRLDSHEALLKGGDSGPAIVPGKPDQSRLILAVRQVDEDLKMPPESKLTDQQVADLTRWVEQGALFPSQSVIAKAKYRDPNHWSFQRPVDPPVPAVKDAGWPQTRLDNFILARLEAAGLVPAPAADRRTLIRRATFDLTGLPPTPEEIDQFLSDEQPGAYARVVDRLLASPAYGERWGRHWLDVARYADSNGLDENICHGNAWRYRDYVVSAFNKDKPFDQFILEQLAGDLLPADGPTGAQQSAQADPAQQYERLIATGFLAIGPKVLAEVDIPKMQMDIVDEQIDTVGRAFLGLTLGCARCHDHKFDPIDTADYYALAGVFKSTHTMDTYTKIARWHEHPTPTPESVALKAAFDAKVAEHKATVQKRVDQADAEAKAKLKAGEAAPEKLETLHTPEAKAEIQKLRDALAAFEKTAPELPSAMGVKEDPVVNVAVHIRGNTQKLGDVVPRRIPRIFGGQEAIALDAAKSGRLELARWLVGTSAQPGQSQAERTSRVLVNRVWRWHFGKGLVRSPDNFGVLGEAPTHPELLDWLAYRCIEQGWSIKSLHRLMMLSATYQMSDAPSAKTMDVDPENRLVSRANVRRLEAEELRDALIAVGGTLDTTMGGSLLKVKNREFFFDHTSKDLTDYTSQRRSLYLPIVRNNVYDLFQLLDYPDAAVTSGDRVTTTIAPQALMMMNSDLVAKCSTDLAARILAETQADDSARIDRLHRIVYGRPATPAEISAGAAMLAEVASAFAPKEPDADKRRLLAWGCLCQVALAANEFVYVK